MKKRLSLFFIYYYFPIITIAQTSKGKDFWLMFNHVYDDVYPLNLYLYISANENTSGVVEIPSLGINQSFTVNAGTVRTITLPASVMMATSEIIESKSVHVKSQNDVVIHGMNYRTFSSDGFLAIPTNSLGKEYYILSSSSYVQQATGSIGIAATDDNTLITIIPSKSTTNHPAGLPFTVTLNKYQSYQIKTTATTGPSTDLSGSKISANKPISVFGSHMCAHAPLGVGPCNFIVEQMPPQENWGNDFFTASLANRAAGDIFRILAGTNNTVVSLNGSVIATLNQGMYYQLDLPSNSFNEINASKPVLITQYCKGYSADNLVGDPFMMVIAPKDQYFGSTVFTTPSSTSFSNKVNIITPDAGIGEIRLDGGVIASNLFTPIGSSGFSGARISISTGTHTLSSLYTKFGSFFYGLAEYDSYGYAAGQNYSNVPNFLAITLPSDTILCAGNVIDVSVYANGYFNIGNTFEAQLSSPTGDFTNPTLVGSSNTIGNISVLIPTNTLEGTNYKIRIISSNPVLNSNISTNLTIYQKDKFLENPNDNIMGLKTIRVSEVLNANNKIFQSANVNYIAGKSIIFNSGFEINTGAIFNAKIIGCN